MHTSPGQIRRLINKNLLLQYKRLERLVFQQLLFRSLDSKLLNKYIKNTLIQLTFPSNGKKLQLPNFIQFWNDQNILS